MIFLILKTNLKSSRFWRIKLKRKKRLKWKKKRGNEKKGWKKEKEEEEEKVTSYTNHISSEGELAPQLS